MKIPESTKSSLEWKLEERQRQRGPQLRSVRVRYRGNLVYVDGVFPDEDVLPLCRLRYGGSATYFGFTSTMSLCSVPVNLNGILSA